MKTKKNNIDQLLAENKRLKDENKNLRKEINLLNKDHGTLLGMFYKRTANTGRKAVIGRLKWRNFFIKFGSQNLSPDQYEQKANSFFSANELKKGNGADYESYRKNRKKFLAFSKKLNAFREEYSKDKTILEGTLIRVR